MIKTWRLFDKVPIKDGNGNVLEWHKFIAEDSEAQKRATGVDEADAVRALYPSKEQD